MIGAEILTDAPSTAARIPIVSYEDFWVMEDKIAFSGINQPDDRYKLVLKMSAGQSAGVSSAWGKTVIISPALIPDWGEVYAIELYTAVIGVAPVEGQKYFIELYWMDSETGFTSQEVKLSAICGPESGVKHEDYVPLLKESVRLNAYRIL